MAEDKVKKRGWVKNVAIIFLAVMLVLTFFSNTFMNRSLPEVAVQYVQSGSINAKIRGTGAVTANENFEVKASQTRKVLSVPVKVGDEVKVGDILINFADADSTEMKTAQTALDDAVFAYKSALIEAGGNAYAAINRKIERAQQELNKAKATREANAYSAADLAAAQKATNNAKMELDLQQARVDSLQEQLSGMTPPADNSSTYAQIQKKQIELAAAQKERDAVKLTYKTEYANLETKAKEWIASDKAASSQLTTYVSALGQFLESQIASAGSATTIRLPYGSSTVPIADAKAMVAAYKAIDAVETKISGLNSDIASLNASLSGGDWNYTTVKTQLKEAREKLAVINNAYNSQKLALTAIEDKKKAFEEADALAETKQTELEAALQSLADQQKNDGKTKLNLEKLKSDVDNKSKELADMKAGSTGASITSQVNGRVASVSITAGNSTAADQALMVVEVPDRGYGITIPVTTEQSKKVKIGDTAEVQYNYGGTPIVATLMAIRNDPEKPAEKKLLSFKLEGEIESGAQISIAIGERGGSYDTLVPNSAVRSDNNGSFVLAVVAKSSPLGNRYVAQRIDVKVLATDDVNSAVSGGLTTSDFVITTSSKPIEPGMLVRMPD